MDGFNKLLKGRHEIHPLIDLLLYGRLPTIWPEIIHVVTGHMMMASSIGNAQILLTDRDKANEAPPCR